MRRFRPLLIPVVLFALSGAARAQDDRTVALPPFIVEEASKGPPWRYAEMPGFEILSRCRDRTTRDLAAAHFRLHRLLELLLPARLQLTFTVPRAIIFYDEELQPAASQEVIAAMLKNQKKDAVPLDPPLRLGPRGMILAAPEARRISFLPNLRLWDWDAMTVFFIVRDSASDSDHLALTAGYVQDLLVKRAPALPAWFVMGVLKLYEHTEYETGALSLGPLEWISEEKTAALKKDPKTAPAPLPLAEFFGGAPSAITPEDAARRAIWLAQGALVVRWALDGRTPAQREAFAEFVDRAAEGVTPAAFQRCFGIDFAAADAQLAAYLPAAVRKSVTLRPAASLQPPKLELRNASDAEIARLKGDWERLEVGYVRRTTPELADKYLEQARRTLRRAYDRDARDPRLLANLGLCECDAGDDAAARGFLEAAARLGPLRPRAAYELARLRFAEIDAAPAGEGGRLSATQVAQIFTPLFAVREQAPPLPEIYELIAQVWARSALRPMHQHLAVLDEGVRLFSRRVPLVYRTAALYADNGHVADAAEFVRLGLVIATDPADRARFEQLQAQLAAASPPPK